ncbi:phosphoenolpyruvate--protein phosphotransferase [Paraferrimonas sedimenticola]|uniref:phosphoenolpyruvate--protein phosphotransferase n=1 Tax=Paraferrimonas sedimenticola TaxID=375674 RepID=A0AA37RWV4_9GAMM|nr:phosphoenolpyruvate--protein phosphotransferase [Paraferrimonas sedimenticola]GLP97205.1 phosphoenolpyruvate--protein phosphotransferase [Paraferrimonas sedimenticola]
MLDRLRDITQTVVNSADLDSAMAALVTQTKRAMATQCCSVYLVRQQHLLLCASDGLSPSAIGKASLKFGEGVIGLVAERAEPINLADAHRHPAFKLIPSVNEDKYSAFLAAPIIHQSEVLGVLAVQQQQKRLFDEDEEAFLVTLAAQLALAVSGLRQRKADKGPQTDILLTGEAASAGLAVAPALLIHQAVDMQAPQHKAENLEAERERLSAAIEFCRNQFFTWSQRFDAEIDTEVAQIFSAYQSLLEPASLGQPLLDEVMQGWQAESAVRRVCLRVAAQFKQMQDAYLRERGRDVVDVGERLIQQLQRKQRLALDPSQPRILVAKEASATLLAELPQHGIAGIVIQSGGVNSHVAILARAMNIPAVMGLETSFEDIEAEQTLIVNGYRGQVVLNPTAILCKEYQRLIEQISAQNQQLNAELDEACFSGCGKPIGLHVNAGLTGALASVERPAVQGIGLYRSEIPFMLHSHFLTESEQFKLYQKVMRSAKGKPVVMRTLDAGGDKPLTYFPMAEANPFLGWRGIRLTLDHPEMLLVQLKAMLRAGVGQGPLSILLPMVSQLSEVERTRHYLEQAVTELKEEYGEQLQAPKLGVMLEIPAMMFQLAALADCVDFISVGSNDLTQYLLAVDRNNPAVSELFDRFHPAVLTALNHIAEQCQTLELPFSICGELAGDPLAVMLLLGMGYYQLSMNPGNLGKVNHLIRRVECADMQRLVQSALSCQSGTQVRDLCLQELNRLQLNDLVR